MQLRQVGVGSGNSLCPAIASPAAGNCPTQRRRVTRVAEKLLRPRRQRAKKLPGLRFPLGYPPQWLCAGPSRRQAAIWQYHITVRSWGEDGKARLGPTSQSCNSQPTSCSVPIFSQETRNNCDGPILSHLRIQSLQDKGRHKRNPAFRSAVRLCAGSSSTPCLEGRRVASGSLAPRYTRALEGLQGTDPHYVIPGWLIIIHVYSCVYIYIYTNVHVFPTARGCESHEG